MVGTRHAVSDNNSKSGLGMPSPYNPEREQIQDRKAGLKEKGKLRVSESRSKVGTRHAVSDNKSTSGLGMPSPYIPEREYILQGQRRLKNVSLDFTFPFSVFTFPEPLCHGSISAPLAKRFCCNMARETIIQGTGTRGL